MEYEVVTAIGKGSFGVVSKIKRKSDGKVLVWKELDYGRMNEKEKQQLVVEVNILRDLKHPHIVRYYDRIIDKKAAKIYIIMEYCEGGDMRTLLRKCKKDRDYIAEDVIWKIFTQILLALSECHSKKSGKILHRDLKPANIFLDGENNIKLGDFGLSRVMSDQSMFAETHVGTPYYMSPEQINESKYNEKSDIWSAGCLLYEIAALRPPFEASNHLSLAIKIREGKFERLPQRYSEDLQKVLELMLNLDSEKRPSAEDLLKIPQIAMRIKEKKLRDKLSQVKQIEEEIRKKEEDLKKLESYVEQKEKKLNLAESKLIKSEKQIAYVEKENFSVTSLSRSDSLEKTRSRENPLAAFNKVMKGIQDRASRVYGATRDIRNVPREIRGIPYHRSQTYGSKNVNKSFNC